MLRTERRTGTPPRCTPPPAGWPPGWAGGPTPRARSGPRTPRSWRPRPPPTAGGWPGSGPPPRPRPDPRPHPPSGASTWPPSGPPWPSGGGRRNPNGWAGVPAGGRGGGPSLTGRGLRASRAPAALLRDGLRPPWTAHPRPVPGPANPAEKPPGMIPRKGHPMPSAEHRSGRCEVITPPPASPTSRTPTSARSSTPPAALRSYLAVRVGRVLLYLEDRVAVDASSDSRSYTAVILPPVTRGAGDAGAREVTPVVTPCPDRCRGQWAAGVTRPGVAGPVSVWAR